VRRKPKEGSKAVFTIMTIWEQMCIPDLVKKDMLP